MISLIITVIVCVTFIAVVFYVCSTIKLVVHLKYDTKLPVQTEPITQELIDKAIEQEEKIPTLADITELLDEVYGGI